jgi:hypothetical protein
MPENTWKSPLTGTRQRNLPVAALAAATATVPGFPASVESPDGKTRRDDEADAGALDSGLPE